ncbi:S8 family peptidase, partial [candidate division WOR-3 bacterium]|nr:S8 family peptidase [candidate division WOR-3 bacterium]
MGGTSMATPATAGAAALIRQYYIDGFYPTGVKTPANTITPSAALMKATLIVSTRNMTGYYTSDNGSSSSKANVPTNGQGWGRIVLDDALYFASDPRKLEINDITGGINNGESHPYNINVGSNTLEDFKVVLVWTDYFGTQSASDPLVNDLNLTISDGTNTYRGNVFGTNGYSITGGSYDATNANEVVWLQGSTVANKSITITVSGYDINHGPQPYALVICGDIGTSGTRTLNFDRDSVKIVYPTGSLKNNKSKTIDDKFEKINDINSQKRIINKSKLHLKLSERKIINNNFRNPLDDTLAYHDTSAYYIKLPNSYGDLGWGNRFTPNYDNDTLREIWFAAGQNLSTSGTPYIYRFRICSNNSGIPGGVLDSFDVSSDDITASSWNGWDIGSFGLLFDTGEDFFVTVHPIGMTSNDTMTIIMDDGTYPAGLGRSYENYSDNSWHTMGEGYGTDYSFLFETVLGYPSPIPTDTATFYIKNDPSSTENLIIYNATDEKDTCWIDTIITPITTIPPGDSAPVNITIDTSGLMDNIYYSNIIIESNATNGTKSNNSIPILLDLNTGLHSGISTIVNKKLTSKLNLIATKNPFIHTTDLKFALPSECDVNITIYDISGKKLNELTNKKYTAGIYKIKWDGKDSNRKTLPSGFYFAKMTTGNKSLSTKIIKLH